ncbi:MAG: class I cytochrome c [Burkholderiaceae bacterium]
MKTRSKMLLAALLALGAPMAWAQADALQVRSWAAGCSNCHGTGGVALPGMESLAGASRADLTRKLLEFKTGTRPATIMQQLAKGYSDEQLEQIAGFFAAQKK